MPVKIPHTAVCASCGQEYGHHFGSAARCDPSPSSPVFVLKDHTEWVMYVWNPLSGGVARTSSYMATTPEIARAEFFHEHPSCRDWRILAAVPKHSASTSNSEIRDILVAWASSGVPKEVRPFEALITWWEEGGISVVRSGPRKPAPALMPEVHRTDKPDPERAMDAVRALCKGQ